MVKVLVSVLVLSVCVASVFGAPQGTPSNDDVQVVRYINDNNGIDNYKFT